MAHINGGFFSATNLKQGYLYIKRERGSSHMPPLLKSWQQSYFVLCGYPIMLQEYREASLKVLRQTLMIDPIKHVGPVRTSKSKEYAFQVVMEGRNPLLLACENALLLDEWIQVFKDLQSVDSAPTPRGGEEPFRPRSSVCGSPDHDDKPRSTSSVAEDARQSEALSRSTQSVDDQHSISKQIHVEKYIADQRARLQAADTFYLTVRSTPLARANLLEGSYWMRVANCRISLLDADTLEEKLSWPLSQVKHFTGLPLKDLLYIETRRNCHFGLGKLAFETNQSDSIAQCIDQQLALGKRDTTSNSRGLPSASFTSSSDGDESCSDAQSRATLTSRRSRAYASSRRENSAEVADEELMEPSSDADTVFVSVLENAESTRDVPAATSSSVAASGAIETGRDEVVGAPEEQLWRAQDGYGPCNSDVANAEYAEIDDCASGGEPDCAGLENDCACAGARDSSSSVDGDVVDAAVDNIGTGALEEANHSYLELTEEDVSPSSETLTTRLLFAIESQLQKPIGAQSPLPSQKGRPMLKSNSANVPDSHPKVLADNRRASEPTRSDVRVVCGRLDKIGENVSVGGCLPADDVDTRVSCVASPKSPRSPRSTQMIISATGVVRPYPPASVKIDSITKSNQLSHGPFVSAMAPFTQSYHSVVFSKAHQQALASQRNRNRTKVSQAVGPTPALDRNNKPDRLPVPSNAQTGNRRHLEKVSSFDVGSDLSSDEGDASDGGRPPPRLPRAPISSRDAPKVCAPHQAIRKQSASQREPKSKVLRCKQQLLTLPRGEGKQRSHSNPTPPSSPPYPNVPFVEPREVPLPPPPLPPKSKLLSATKSAPWNRTSSEDPPTDFGNEPLRASFSSDDFLKLVEPTTRGSEDRLTSVVSDDSTYGSGKDVSVETKAERCNDGDCPPSLPLKRSVNSQSTASMVDLLGERSSEVSAVDGCDAAPSSPTDSGVVLTDGRSLDTPPCTPPSSPPEVSPWLKAGSPFLMSHLPDVVLRRSELNDVGVPHASASRRYATVVAPVSNLPKLFVKKEEFPFPKKLF